MRSSRSPADRDCPLLLKRARVAFPGESARLDCGRAALVFFLPVQSCSRGRYPALPLLRTRISSSPRGQRRTWHLGRAGGSPAWCTERNETGELTRKTPVPAHHLFSAGGSETASMAFCRQHDDAYRLSGSPELLQSARILAPYQQ
jgi:hypothetical protein